MSRSWLGLCLLLMLASALLAWQVQGWRYGRQLADQATRHAQQMRQQADALADQLLAERALFREEVKPRLGKFPEVGHYNQEI